MLYRDRIKENEISRSCGTNVEKKNAYRVWWGKPKGKTIRRPRHSWEMIIKMDLIEMGCKGMLWTNLAPNMDKWPAVLHPAMKYPVQY
jgi:hypothetical protein